MRIRIMSNRKHKVGRPRKQKSELLRTTGFRTHADTLKLVEKYRREGSHSTRSAALNELITTHPRIVALQESANQPMKAAA